jgi:UDP-GlcNAc:undecaprenyl-phosphate GlcNAc-1-phosphate transferase
MNSLNMLDNMDGITATVSFFVLLACMTSYFIEFGFVVDFWILLLIAQLGALIGFLRYNINPSKMFMGDAGSQFLGLFVAFFAIKGLWNTSAMLEVPAWSGFLVVLAAFTPAAVDTLTVVINRLKKGQSPMVGGKDHTTHHLVYRGLNDFQVWKVFLFLSVFSALLAVGLIIAMQNDLYMLALLGVLFFLCVFVILYRNTLKYKSKPKL